MMCLLNVITALLLLQGFLSSASSRSKFSPNSATLKYVRESEEIRYAMRPLGTNKKSEGNPTRSIWRTRTVQEKDTRQTVAALEEWRKRKMERARLRDRGKNATLTSQA
ncbi:hypothetical protein M0R45_018580 [Rubus argutus]|uniref:Secreted protein n=1 Tax=Rubus argutus TaxID=59490 RepID=A0AAW1X5C3_RUBAR